MFKLCCRCKTPKDISEFQKDKIRKDGLKPDCRLCRSKQCAQYRAAHIDKERNRHKLYRDAHKDYIKVQSKGYRKRAASKIKLTVAKYFARNSDKIRAQRAKHKKERMAVDLNFRIASMLRCRVRAAISNGPKMGSAVRDLGCSIGNFKEHLEKQFKPGMSWDNWSADGWHIDHIIPLSKFNLSDRSEFLKATNYTNMQPLWATDNLKKSNK